MANGQQFVVSRKRKDRVTRGTGSRYRKKSGVFATPAGFAPSGSGATRSSVIEAAKLFLAQARKNAAKFSRRIPAATYVAPYEEQQAQIVTDGVAAPNAAPFEFGERHPLFGDRHHWYRQPRRSYMSRAATNKKTIDQAAEIYAQIERDLLAEEHGYTE